MKLYRNASVKVVLYCMFLTVCILYSPETTALEAAVSNLNGSPTIFINGKPSSPLMFFGWESGLGEATDVTLTTEWQEFSITVIALENTDAASGIHFRIGGEGPGTVWVDNVHVYPGEKMDTPPSLNWVRNGGFEGARDDIARDWSFYQRPEAKAEWSIDSTTKVDGQQSLRIDIAQSGTDHMHLHWYQTGYSVQAMQKYTYSLWMKADKPRVVDFMMLHINDPWTIYRTASASISPYIQQVQLARDAGVHLYSFGIPMPWPEAGKEYDFSEVNRCIGTTLQHDPDALLLPRFGMAPPEWWLAQHPDDRLLFDDGQTVSMSMASEAWRTEMQVHLRALVRHCEKEFGDHILGYHPCGQHTGEWFYERSWEERLSDFSPAMNMGFRKWLQTRYGTVAALREAWGNPEVTFETVQVPAAEQQRHATLGFFRDPLTERFLSDYFLYKQIAMEEPLEMMARVIKEETKRTKLTCFFYGYIFDMHGIPMGPQISGHLAMSRMLQCPDVDILCSPISYLDRELGGAGCFMSAVDSVRAHGKLWLNEDDTRTYLTPKDSGFGRVDSPEGTYWVHQRNFAQIWPRRMAAWYMDLGGIGWLGSKDLWDNLGRLQEYYQQHITEPASWNPDVAVILDEDSPSYTACTLRLGCPLVYEIRSQYYRMGAPFGIYLLSDLVAGKVPPAKVYFFANCYRLDDQQRQAVLNASRGKTAVWFYGGGFISDTADDANITQMNGIQVKRGAPEVGRVTSSKQLAQLLTSGLPDTFGHDTLLDPLWTVDDPEAEILARFPSGAPAAAVKSTPDGLRVYIGTLHCPAALLRNILTASGVHVYNTSDDVVLTDGRFFSITATSPGRKSVRFPKACSVYTALDDTEVVSNTTQLDVDLNLGETRLYVLR